MCGRRPAGAHAAGLLALLAGRAAASAFGSVKPQEEETEDSTTRLSVYGDALGKCDRPAYMAANPSAADSRFPNTGYLRDDYCGSMTGDRGSHYVCVNLPNATVAGGGVYSPFWTKTGQAKDGRQALTWPKPGPWCICMWAFARMYGHHPEFLEAIECSATNYWVVQNYDLANANECRALQALCGRCGLDRDDRVTRQHIGQKCALTARFCPPADAAEPEKCSMHGGCEL